MERGAWVAFVGPFLFPWGQPGSRRVYGIAMSLAETGRQVIVGSGETRPPTVERLERCRVGEVGHVGLSELHRPEQSIFSKAVQYFMLQGRNTVRWLDAQPTRPSHVIVYGGYAPFMARMLPWCRRNGVALLVDVVEWYDPRQLAGGWWSPFNACTKFALRYQFPKCDGVIAISSLLEKHYQDRGVPTIRVPPTLNVADVEWREDAAEGSVLSLIYAGTPGRKDLLRNIIEGVASVDPDGTRVVLDVLGPTMVQVQQLMGARAKVPRGIRVRGRVPQAEVAKSYRAAEFSVLLREPLRFAHAGFPTKVPESLAVGTPVICNRTSDLPEYIRDGEEGLFCADHSAQAFASAVRTALSLAPSRRGEMRRAARLAAETFFEYRNYSNELSAFLERCRYR